MIRQIISGLCIVLIFIVPSNHLLSQQSRTYQSIGERITPFHLANVDGVVNKIISTDNLKGKYFILDFWGLGCKSCIQSFPKMYELQKKFSDRLTIVLVAPEYKDRDIRAVYKKIRDKQQIRLISAYDSAFFRKFVYEGVPHLVWVNSEGVIKAITGTEDANEQNVKQFVGGDDFPFTDNSYQQYQKRKQSDFTENSDTFNTNNTNTVRSALFPTPITKESPSVPDLNSYKVRKRGRYDAVKASLNQLYLLAFTGKTYIPTEKLLEWYPKVCFNVPDSSNLSSLLLNYSLQLPRENFIEENIAATLRQDLKNLLGYHAAVVRKKMPCLELIVVNPQKIKLLQPLPGQDTSYRWHIESNQNEFVNVKLDDLRRMIASDLPFDFKSRVKNKTAIHGNVSMKINSYSDDYEGLRRELKKYGLDLVVGEIEMNVIQVSTGQPTHD